METKQLKVVVPAEIHKRMRIALAEDGSSFATWMYTRITDYLQKKGKLEGEEVRFLEHLGQRSQTVYEPTKPAKVARSRKKKEA